jgi:hypothetical protein
MQALILRQSVLKVKAGMEIDIENWSLNVNEFVEQNFD